MSFDLHTHSIHSDGLLNPEELVVMASQKKLNGISLTDHDTLNGIDEFQYAGKKYGVLTIPGVEITTQHQGTEFHILGYNIDLHHFKLRKRLEEVIESRNNRAREIISLLNRAGIEVTYTDVEKFTTGGYVGRPHIYRALKDRGYVGDDPDRKGFDYYLGSRGIAYVPHRELDTFEAIELVTKAGGCAVLAHPGRLDDRLLINALIEHGLTGIEVFYPTHTPELINELLGLADKYGLLVTGGSDFHGVPGNVELGEASVEERYIERLITNVCNQ